MSIYLSIYQFIHLSQISICVEVFNPLSIWQFVEKKFYWFNPHKHDSCFKYSSQIKRDEEDVQICKIGRLRKPYLKSDSLLSVRDIKIYLFQKLLILFQNFTEEHLKERVIKIFTTRDNQVLVCLCDFMYALESVKS